MDEQTRVVARILSQLQAAADAGNETRRIELCDELSRVCAEFNAINDAR